MQFFSFCKEKKGEMHHHFLPPECSKDTGCPCLVMEIPRLPLLSIHSSFKYPMVSRSLVGVSSEQVGVGSDHGDEHSHVRHFVIAGRQVYFSSLT